MIQCRHVQKSALPTTTISAQAIAGRAAPIELDDSVQVCAVCAAAVVAMLRHLSSDGQHWGRHKASFSRLLAAVAEADS